MSKEERIAEILSQYNKGEWNRATEFVDQTVKLTFNEPDHHWTGFVDGVTLSKKEVAALAAIEFVEDFE